MGIRDELLKKTKGALPATKQSKVCDPPHSIGLV